MQFEGGRIPEAVVHYILQAGIQAPSGDNAQPWKFRAPGNVIDLYLDRKADNSFFNIDQTASIISCGAVLENMRVAASVFGLSTDIELLPNQKEPDLMARVTLRFTMCDSDGLAPMIWQRQTNRKFYGADPVAASDQDIILQSITGFDGTRLHLITDRPALKRLAGLVCRIDRIRTEHRPLHAHLNKMIRFTREEAVQKRDGLPLRNLEAGVAGELFLKITRPWFIMNMANRLGIGKLAACHSLRGILKAGGAGLLTVNGTEAAALLTGGRALERLWLTLSSLGIAMQPMTAITLFWHRWQTEGDVSFQRIHRPLLERAWKD